MKSDLMELVRECETVGLPRAEVDTSALHSKAQELESLGLISAAKQVLAKAEKEDRHRKVAGFIRIQTSDIEKFLDKKVEEYNKAHAPKASDKKQSRWEREFLSLPASGAMDQYSRYLEQPQIAQAQALRESLYNARSQMLIVDDPETGGRGDAEAVARRQAEWYQSIDDSLIRPSYHATVRISRDQGGDIFLSSPNGISRRTCDYLNGGEIGQFVWEEKEIKDYAGIPPQKVLDRIRQVKELGVFEYFTVASVKGIKDPLVLGRFKDDNDNRYFIDQWGDDVKIEELM